MGGHTLSALEKNNKHTHAKKKPHQRVMCNSMMNLSVAVSNDLIEIPSF